MRYFIDTEFLEGTQKRRFMGYELPSFFDTKSTIDLISIGIVAEDGRELYCISKDFNLEEAWNRYDLKKEYPDDTDEGAITRKVFWIRDNVLLPIYKECVSGDARNHIYFTYSGMKAVLDKYGKSNKQIAEEIKQFVSMDYIDGNRKEFTAKVKCDNHYVKSNPQFYGYYSAYDHVALCWLFGKMIDLPKGFPMLTLDLKQMLGERAKSKLFEWGDKANNFDMLNHIKTLSNYPKQTNEHSAIHDARWNKELYEFLQSL